MGRHKKEENEEVETKEETQKTEIKEIGDLPGVGPTTSQKLIDAGFDNLMSIAVSTPKEIVDVSGLTEVMARKIIKASRDNLNMGFISGNEVKIKRSNQNLISFGSKNIDGMMGGGLHPGAITEFYGSYGSGKTQLGHLLSVMVQKQYPEAIVIYIDSENTFRNERIEHFAKGLKLDGEKVLENIRVAKAFNTDHQMLLVDKVEELIKQGLKVKLIVVDSLTAHFRAEYTGRGTLADRQQKLNKHMHKLSKLADMYDLAVYVTNQVMAKPDAFFGDPNAPIGGNIVGHNSTYRVYIRHGKKGCRVAKLVDSPELPDSECAFFIKEEGLEDVE